MSLEVLERMHLGHAFLARRELVINFVQFFWLNARELGELDWLHFALAFYAFTHCFQLFYLVEHIVL